MLFQRMKIEEESPEQFGYDKIKYNLTESSTTDKTMADVGISLPDNLMLCYGDHLGKQELRELIAEKYGAKADDVIVTVGACMALFNIYSALLKPGDHVLILHPNYPADVEIPKSLGCDVELFRLKFEEQFRLDVDRLIDSIRKETKLVCITYPHNPTGSMIGAKALEKLAKACDENQIYLLVDETYGDLTFGERLPHVSNLTPYGICVESLSKAVGIPGIRVGWIVTRNSETIGRLIAAKEQICICGSVIDEECAYQVMRRNEEILAPIRNDISEKFEILCEEMEQQDVLEWIKPEGGVICFPHVKDEIEIDTEELYKCMNEKYGVYVGPGHWFDLDDRYFRLGYAWPGKEELRAGIRGIIAAIQDVRKN